MELGAKLKEAREARNLSLEDVQKVTKIQTRYLQAIEKGNFSAMPGSFYVRAFVKEYATAVGLDADLFMEEHASELPKASNESSVQYSRVRSRNETTSTKSPAIFSFLPTLIVVLLIVGIFFLVWYFISTNDDGKSEEQVKTGGPDEVLVGDSGSTSEEKPEDTTEDTGSGDTTADDTEEQPEEPTNEPELKLVEETTDGAEGVTTYDLVNAEDSVQLVLNTDNEHWLEIENDKGKSFYNGMFAAAQAPQEIDLTGEERVHLRFGNPRDLKITVNGVDLQLPETVENGQIHQVWINLNASATE
ncbi:RodZ domain-containing protein [Radiobacillus deserti]|uniref:Helix-turn-helix domain-containing protein n=1 Tax=Radiobacillus deserti TaxID=2594883 RepID=A0A516KFV0_9BACI|nr:RodZ domain-containing protein [Radiobacillus deserti]QDP40246.1 helix-turn-helix domain-containing protein [Radiobacillus deserti]